MDNPDPVVGGAGCLYQDISPMILESLDLSNSQKTTSISKIRDLAIKLQLPPDIVRLQLTDFGPSVADALHLILASWREKVGSAATVRKLIQAFRSMGHDKFADNLQVKFLSGNTQYGVPPNGFTDFMASEEKRLLILCTINKSSTKEKIKDTIRTPMVFFTGEEAFLEKLPEQGRGILLVYCSSDRRIERLLPRMTGIRGKVVLITEEGIDNIQKDTSAIPWISVEEDVLKWDHLNDTFQCRLKGRRLNLQNEYDDPKLTLRDILTEDSGSELEGQLLIDLINNDVPSLVPNGLPDPLNYYVPRRLTRKWLDKPYSEETLIGDYKNTFKSNDTVIISDSPATGKTQLLANLARKLVLTWDECCSKKIVLFWSFAEVILKIKEKLEGNLLEAPARVELYWEILVNANFGRKFVLKELKSGRLSADVLLDGFDEVPRQDLEMAKEMLTHIFWPYGYIRLWVTTRSDMLLELEELLHIPAHNIQPFNDQDQERFLLQFWTDGTTREYDFNCLTKFTEKLIQRHTHLLANRRVDITESPLQFLTSIYEQTSFNLSLYSNLNTSNIVSIAELFRSTIQTKLDMFLEQCPLSSNMTKKQLMYAHVHISLRLLFPDLIVTLQDIVQVKPLNMLPDLLAVGLIQKTEGNNDFPQLIYVKMADYFVAWFAHHLMQHGTRDDLLKILLNAIFQSANVKRRVKFTLWDYTEFKQIDTFAFKHPGVCYFLDNIVDPSVTLQSSYAPDAKIFHSCVTGNFPRLFEFFLNMKRCQRSFVDKNILLVAVKCSTVEILSSLSELFQMFERKQKWKLADLVYSGENLKFTLLHVGVRCRTYSFVEHLVDEQGFREYLEKNQGKFKKLVNFCVDRSTRNDEFLIGEKIKILRLLAGVSKWLFAEFDVAGKACYITPLYKWGLIHPRLLQEIFKFSCGAVYRGLPAAPSRIE